MQDIFEMGEDTVDLRVGNTDYMLGIECPSHELIAIWCFGRVVLRL